MQRALQQFLARFGQPGSNRLDRGLARALSDADPETFLPIRVTDTFEGRIVSAMRDRGFWISRHSECVNIVYIEGAGPDGSMNGNEPNVFNVFNDCSTSQKADSVSPDCIRHNLHYASNERRGALPTVVSVYLNAGAGAAGSLLVGFSLSCAIDSIPM